MRDPFEKGVVIYVALFIISIWGSVCDKVLHKKPCSASVVLVGPFVGLIIAMYCFENGLRLERTIIYVALGSYSASKTLELLSVVWERVLARIYGDDRDV